MSNGTSLAVMFPPLSAARIENVRPLEPLPPPSSGVVILVPLFLCLAVPVTVFVIQAVLGGISKTTTQSALDLPAEETP